MTAGNNLWADISSIANSVQEGAYHVVREVSLMQDLVYTYRDLQGMNPRKTYKYGQLTAKEIGEDDDLVSDLFTPELDQTFTPGEIGLAAFISNARKRSDAPEDIVRDASLELGLAIADKVESDLVGELANLTGGSIGAAGTAITWGYVGAAISQARNASKSATVPLMAVIHGYQAAVLAKTASVAGATSIAQAPGVSDEITRRGLTQAFVYLGVPIYQSFASPDSNSDFTGGVFRRECIAIDWRQALTIEAEYKATKRGSIFVATGVYAHGVKRPALGISMIFDATAPTS